MEISLPSFLLISLSFSPSGPFRTDGPDLPLRAFTRSISLGHPWLPFTQQSLSVPSLHPMTDRPHFQSLIWLSKDVLSSKNTIITNCLLTKKEIPHYFLLHPQVLSLFILFRPGDLPTLSLLNHPFLF